MDMHGMWNRMGWGHSSAQYVPAPQAFFGLAVSFMLGMLLGIMMGKKAMVMKMMGGKAMHHHHGWGMPGCCEPHGEGHGKGHGHGHGWGGHRGSTGEPAMPEGGGGRAERDEGE